MPTGAPALPAVTPGPPTRDELSRERRDLPWVPVEEDYVFQTTDGDRTLAELFGARSQLLVYHFMYGPDWDAGCPSCSFWMDSLDGTGVHLAHRDVEFVVVSRAPLDLLQAYRERMGWRFRRLVGREPVQLRLRRVVHGGRATRRGRIQLRVRLAAG